MKKTGKGTPQNNGGKPTLYITPDESKAIQMGLGMILEDMESSKMYPWNPESRKDMREIVAAARSAAAKVEKITGISSQLPPYIDGEEKDYFTKES